MSDDRDPLIQNLFAIANEDLEDQAFTEAMMLRIAKQQRLTIIQWVCIGLIMVVCLWLFAAPIQDVVYLLTRGLTISLVDVDEPILGQISSPVNSVATLVALCLIVVRQTLRKIFSR